MSATILLKQTMARRTDAVMYFCQHCLVIAGLVLVLGITHLIVGSSLLSGAYNSILSGFSLPHAEEADDSPVQAPSGLLLSPGMQGALTYVAQRYRVSAEALQPVFGAAQEVGKERRIDPLLIVAVIAVESRFNPFAESPLGAQGLMQIIPRFHMDKIPEGAGDRPFLDPATNIRIGVSVLEEAIRRRGSLEAGLQYYAGSTDPEGGYASKVLAEKERLEQAARRSASPKA